MILTLENAVEKLIELNLVPREIVEKRKAEKHFGKKSCHILRKFQSAVRKNSSNFFTEAPCLKIFDQKARALFKKGRSQFYPPKVPRSLPRKRSYPESPVESPKSSLDYCCSIDERKDGNLLEFIGQTERGLSRAHSGVFASRASR